MLQTLTVKRPNRAIAYEVIGIAAFTAITAISARISIPMDPVPFTLQPLAVLLSGLVLGARGGALSQLAYLALIGAGLPLDANMRGAAALLGPTAGYLIGFVPAAFVTGLLGANRNAVWVRLLAGIAGIAVIYLFGVSILAMNRSLDLGAAWMAGGAPFIVPDIAKAIIAAALAEGGRALLARWQS